MTTSELITRVEDQIYNIGAVLFLREMTGVTRECDDLALKTSLKDAADGLMELRFAVS